MEWALHIRDEADSDFRNTDRIEMALESFEREVEEHAKREERALVADLLAALVKINATLRGEGDLDDYAIDIAEAAIAKAEGR